ncbi:MAG: hypothetical protein ACLQU9_01060 [Acidimicrobiales bacterium]
MPQIASGRWGLGSDGLDPPDDADIRDEFACAGREAVLGFHTIGGIFGRPLNLAMPESCPDCVGMNLVVAIDRRQQHNYLCRDRTMCWHPEFGQLHEVDPEICPGFGLATTACFERFEFERFQRPAILTV